MIAHLLSDLENNWQFLQFSCLEGVGLVCFGQHVCFLTRQQGKCSGLFYEGNLLLELVKNSIGFLKYKFYQTNLNLINQEEAIDAIFLDMSNDSVATESVNREHMFLLEPDFYLQAKLLVQFCI